MELEQYSENMLSHLVAMTWEIDPMFLHLQSCHVIDFCLMMLLPNIKGGIVCAVLRTMAVIVLVFPIEGGKGRG